MNQRTKHGVPFHNRDAAAADIREIIGGKRDPIIIEVGAADGQTTQQFLDEMPGAEIICFEPDPRCWKELKRKFRNHSQVRLFNVAVSDRCGTAVFHQSGGAIPHSTEPCKDDWYLSGSLHEPTGHLARDQWVKFPTTVEVETQTLDFYAPAFFIGTPADKIDLIWADTQGSEAVLILGGKKTLHRTRWLYIEFYDVPQYERQPDLKGILSFLPDFELVSIWADNALLKNRTIN